MLYDVVVGTLEVNILVVGGLMVFFSFAYRGSCVLLEGKKVRMNT